MSGTATSIAMESTDLEVANWSEKVEDLVESGAIDNAISLLETLILKLQSLSSTVVELQLTSALLELAKLYDFKGFSIRADEARARAIAIKNRSLRSLPPHQSSFDTPREESERIRVSIGGELSESSCSTKDILVNDGNSDTLTKSSIGNEHPGEAFSDDDWEARADDAPDELLPTQQLPEVSKISLEDSVEIPKRRGRGTFSYKKDSLYSDQLAEDSIVCDSEKTFDDTDKQDSTVRNSVAYGTRHVLVLDGFQPSYTTMDLENTFKNFKDKFVIRWVNDTLALAVFRSPSVEKETVAFHILMKIVKWEALEACNSVHCQFSVRLLEEDDILMNSVSSKDLEPPRQRPQTSARTAQRLIAQGMGIKIPQNIGSKEWRKEEEARKNRIVARQNLRDDAWGPDD